jgi:hypothetical protein
MMTATMSTSKKSVKYNSRASFESGSATASTSGMHSLYHIEKCLATC